MHIALDLLLAEKEPGGMLFATRALLEGLARIDQLNTYTIVASRPNEYQPLTLLPNINIHTVQFPFTKGALIQHQFVMLEALRKIQPDLLHVPAFAAPLGWSGPLVLTVNDLAFLKIPQQSSYYARLYWQYALRESVRRSHAIIAISSQTRNELISCWSVEQSRIHVIHSALRPSLYATDIASADIQHMQQRFGGRYLLHVGRIMPRKNIEILLSAFDLLASHFSDLHLVLVGGTGYACHEVLQQIAASPYHTRIHQLGWIPDADMVPLYAAASMLVFPSLHEGFGLPTIEAMACGTPVIASPEAASVEIAGEAVMRTDCSNAQPLADTIAQLLTNETLRQQLIHLGRVQAQPFTATACAQATLRVYQETFANFSY